MHPTRLPHTPYDPRFRNGVRPEPSMERRTFMALVSGGLLAAPLSAEAQPAGKVPRVAFSPSDVPKWREGFRQGLRDFGYTEGRNIVIEYRGRRARGRGGGQR